MVVVVVVVVVVSFPEIGYEECFSLCALTLLVLWQEGHPACKKLSWLRFLSGTRCRLAYGPSDATATPVYCFSKIWIGFTFLVPGYPGSPGKGTIKRVFVLCMCGWEECVQNDLYCVRWDVKDELYQSVLLNV